MKSKIVILILIVLIVLPLIVVRLLSKFPPDLMTYIGIGLIVPSFVLLVIAIVHLGASFAVTPQAKELVTKGLYAKIRHPIYVFGLLLFIGFAMVTRDVISYLFLGAVLINVIWRVRRENRVLEEKFGDACRAYHDRVWF